MNLPVVPSCGVIRRYSLLRREIDLQKLVFWNSARVNQPLTKVFYLVKWS